MSNNSIVVTDVTTKQTEDLTWLHVAIGMSFILLDIGVSTVFRLGVGISLLVAALRCIGQLALVATILHQVFERKNPWMVALICCEPINRHSICSFTHLIMLISCAEPFGNI